MNVCILLMCKYRCLSSTAHAMGEWFIRYVHKDLVWDIITFEVMIGFDVEAMSRDRTNP